MDVLGVAPFQETPVEYDDLCWKPHRLNKTSLNASACYISGVSLGIVRTLPSTSKGLWWCFFPMYMMCSEGGHDRNRLLTRVRVRDCSLQTGAQEATWSNLVQFRSSKNIGCPAYSTNMCLDSYGDDAMAISDRSRGNLWAQVFWVAAVWDPTLKLHSALRWGEWWWVNWKILKVLMKIDEHWYFGWRSFFLLNLITQHQPT
jgi:hypothetical protein